MAEKETTTKSTKAKVKTKVTQNKIEKVDRYVYLGPTLQKGKYKAGKIFKELPKELESYFEEKPSLKSLFVKSDRLPRAKVTIKKSGSALQTIYKDILKWSIEGGK